MRRLLTLAARMALGVACAFGCEAEPEPNLSETLEPSPNATITPSPLIAGGSLVAKTTKAPPSKPGTKKAGSELVEPPTPLAAQTALAADEVAPKQPIQLTLTGRLYWPLFPGTLKTSTTLSRQLDVATKTQRQFEVNLRSYGRMQITFYGNTFAFEDGTSVASRFENYGHLLVWPNARSYRVLPVGSLRTLFTEGRPDVTPVVHLEPESDAASDVWGRATRIWTLETSRGKLRLHQTRVEEAELSGPCLCRFLLEWLSIAPTSSLCEPGLVPSRAEFTSPRGGRLVWEVGELELRADPDATKLPVPPRDAQFRQYGVPEPEPVLTPSELGLLRKSAKPGSLTAHNPTKQLQWLLLDGTPVARLSPNRAWTSSSVSQGTYTARLVDFFGAEAASQPGLVVGDEATFGEPAPPSFEPEQ